MGGRGEWTREIIQVELEPEFEYDPNKSKSNKEKHGIDFEEAKSLWKDSNKIQYSSKYKEEPRELLFAVYNGKHYTAVITKRNGKVRIISVRRSHEDEVRIYEKENNDR
ncbi:MAG: BrnT family toxin [Clostridiales Family XIII bacterium]|jgi:uncharacterized DUF497 family protein|nr:BrnT family toxin [Clostridiales Family XIII bacterium]